MWPKEVEKRASKCDDSFSPVEPNPAIDRMMTTQQTDDYQNTAGAGENPCVYIHVLHNGLIANDYAHSRI